MNIIKKLDSLLGSFGSLRSMERNHVDTYTENKIQQIKGLKITGDDFTGIWVEFNELSDYLFMDTVIVSDTNIKTFNGCTLCFIGDQNKTIKSDTQEITSNYSNISRKWITEISFIVSKEEIKFVENKKYESIQLQFKKKLINFNLLK